MSDTTPWEAVARRSITMTLTDRRIDVHDALMAIEQAIQSDAAVSNDDLAAARQAIIDAQRLLEECIVPLVADAESWERVPDELTTEQLTEQLGVTVDDINLGIWLHRLRDRDFHSTSDDQRKPFRADLESLIDDALDAGFSETQIAAELLYQIDSVDDRAIER